MCILFNFFLFVPYTDLLSVLTPSTKCLLPGRNVYHWRRRRSNRRPFLSPPCLPLSFPSIPPTLDISPLLLPTSSQVLLALLSASSNAPSADSLLSCLENHIRSEALTYCGCLLFFSWFLHHCCNTQPDTQQPEHTVCPVFSPHSSAKRVLDHIHTIVM